MRCGYRFSPRCSRRPARADARQSQGKTHLVCKLHITNFDSEIRKVTLVASKCSAMPRVRPSWRAWRTPSLVKGMVRPGGGENPAEPTAYRRLLAWDHPLWT